MPSPRWPRGCFAKVPCLSWLANRQRWLNSVGVRLIELWRSIRQALAKAAAAAGSVPRNCD